MPWAARASWRQPRCCTSTTGFFCGETGELQRRCTDEHAEDKQPCGGHILRLAVYSGFLGEAAIARLRAGYARAVASLIRLQPS